MDDPASAAVDQILSAIEEITEALSDNDPKGALERATHWAKIIGTGRTYLLALAQIKVRDGRTQHDQAKAIRKKEPSDD